MSNCTKQLFCAPCSRKFDTQDEFNEHLKSHLTRNRSTFMTYIQPHECVICHRRFDIKSHLELHFNTHILNPDSICPFCGLDCKSIVGLEVHARQCSEIFLKTGCSYNLDETNSSDSNTTEPSCSQLEVRNQLFGKTVESDDIQKANESQIKLLALIATAASFTQEDKSTIQESLEKSPDNSYGGLFNGKESKAYKTYLKASYRYGIPKPNNYVNAFPSSLIKCSQSKKQGSKIYGGLREKSYSCEYCSEHFSRKCVLGMHMQKHLLEEKNHKLDHFHSSKNSKPRACKTNFTDNKHKFVTSSTDVLNDLAEQPKNKTKNLPKILSSVLPKMQLPYKTSVNVLKSKITKKVPVLKSSEISEVSEEPVAIITSVEQDKNKTMYKLKDSTHISTSRKRLPRRNLFEQNRNVSKIISKNTSKKPIPRLARKNYIDQDENKKKNIPKSDIHNLIPRMRLPRKCSLKVLKSKISNMNLASKNNRSLKNPEVPVKPGKNLKLKMSIIRRNALAIKLKIKKKYSKTKSYNLRKRNKNEVGKELRGVKPKYPTKKRKHNNELKFKCDVCQKAFNDSFKVRRHYVQHTGEKPYSCLGCKKRFTRTDHLKRHSRICGKRTRARK